MEQQEPKEEYGTKEPAESGGNLEPSRKPGTFSPGFDPRRNLAGKPAGTRNFTTKVREALAKIAEGTNNTHEELLVKRILQKAIKDGNTAMINIIWEQLDGKPSQTVRNEFDDNVNEVKVTIVRKKDDIGNGSDSDIREDQG